MQLLETDVRDVVVPRAGLGVGLAALMTFGWMNGDIALAASCMALLTIGASAIGNGCLIGLFDDQVTAAEKLLGSVSG